MSVDGSHRIVAQILVNEDTVSGTSGRREWRTGRGRRRAGRVTLIAITRGRERPEISG